MSLSVVKKNIIANFSGKALSILVTLICIPIYVKLMGIESYGLLGIFTSLTALLGMLDMGLSATLNRELAKLSISREADQESRDLVRTLESVYWGIGILISAVVVALGPSIAHQWIKSHELPAKTVQQAVMIMGIVVAFQWPVSLYSGGLMGLQRHVLLNSVKATMVVIQHIGAVLVLWLISPTILTYFIWQILVSIFQTLFLAIAVWKALPAPGRKSSFQWALFKKNRRFAAGMMSIIAISAVLSQVDKIVLSRMLPLAAFGYYIFALNLANSVIQFVDPFYSALFPKISQLIAEKSGEASLSLLYHKACRMASALVLPAACVLGFYSEEIILFWARDPLVASNTHGLLSLLVVGSAINALMVLPLTLQLAHGWTKLSFIKNIVATLVLIPLMIWMAGHFGAPGAAIVWIILNGGYLVIEIPIMHKRLLKHDMWQWYVRDVGTPLLLVFSVVFVSRFLMPSGLSSVFVFLWILITGSAALLLSLFLASPTTLWGNKATIL